MKRLIAFALALAVVFGVSFALYKPERIEAAARETMEDEWVGYFFALEPFDGRRYATETGDDYDFGVPGVPVFVTITAFEPDDPDYEEGSEFNYSVGAAVSDEAVGSGMRVNVDDNGSSYETSGEICYASGEWKPVKQCSVYRTSDGKYYAEWDRTGMGPRVGVSREESVEWKVNGRTERRSIKVSITFEEHTAVARGIRRRRSSRDPDRAGRRVDACRDADECGRHKRPLALHAGRSVRQSLCALDAFWPPACRRCVARLGREWDLTNS